ncbi:arginyltransferase [Thiolapillus sp.]
MRVNLGITPEHPCNYIPGRESRSLVVVDEELLTPASYEALLQQGYRRSGGHVYRPWCATCRACNAVRIPVKGFQPDRGQRRCQKKNQDLRLEWSPAILTDEQYQLYLDYQQHRHPGGAMAQSSWEETQAFLLAGWNQVQFLEMRLEDELVAVACTDILPRSLSAVYTFFRPDLARRSLGTFGILEQIAFAVREGKDWLYLGYWIAECRKMSYKSRFWPHEIRRPKADFHDERWELIEKSRVSGDGS